MSMLDKLLGAVSPLESESVRRETRRQAGLVALRGDWLFLALKQHSQIEDAFDAALEPGPDGREHVARLARLLGAHSLAEEQALYPLLANAQDKSCITKAFTEQAVAKAQIALLDTLEPAHASYHDKLTHLRGAVLHHMYEEESTWFLEIKQLMVERDEASLTARYRDEFDMFMEREAQRALATAVTH